METSKTTRNLVLAAMFAAITAVLAILQIPLPFTPVPITLQVAGCAMAGAILGSRIGGLSQLIYVLIGAVGVPVFAGGTAGFGKLVGPTGGYLIGFVVGAYVIGLLVELIVPKAKNAVVKYIGILVAMLAGLAIIYILGVAQLMFVAKLDLAAGIKGGLLPFLASDIAKVVFASVVAYFVRHALLKSGLLVNKVK